MKKLFLILVFMVPLSLLNAKSDIQITSPFVSFFNKFEVLSEGVEYENSKFFNINKYLNFYVRPYIAFCINLY